MFFKLDVPVNRLAQTVYNGLNLFYSLNLKPFMEIVDASEFDPRFANKEKSYIIAEPEGIRIYSPVTVDEIKENPWYAIVGITVVKRLFCDEQKGSLQENYEQEHQKAFDTLNKVFKLLSVK